MGYRIVGITSLIVIGFLLQSVAHAQQVIYLIRHAEVDLSMRSEDPPLTAAGHERAKAWANILRDAAVRVIFTNERIRSKETAQHIAEASNIPIEFVPRWDTEGLVSRLRMKHRDEEVLIVSHWLAIPHLLKALGHSEDVEVGRDDFDNLFVVVPNSNGGPTVLRLRF